MSDSAETDTHARFSSYCMFDSPETDKYRIKKRLGCPIHQIGHPRRMKKPETYRTGLQTPTLSVSQGAHLLRIDDLLVLTAFLRTLGTFERIDLLPASEVDRLDTARLQ